MTAREFSDPASSEHQSSVTPPPVTEVPLASTMAGSGLVPPVGDPCSASARSVVSATGTPPPVEMPSPTGATPSAVWPPVDDYCRRVGGEPEPDEDLAIASAQWDEPFPGADLLREQTELW